MAYKFQLGTAKLSGSISPTDDGSFDLGASGKEFKDLYIDGTAYLDAIDLNGTAISSTAAELNKLDGADANVTAAKLNTLAALSDAEIGFCDGASAGTVANNKSVVYGASGQVNGTTVSASAGLSGQSVQIEIGQDYGARAAGNFTIGASMGANTLTIGQASSTITVAGNLTVNGTTTTIDSTTLLVEDSLIEIARGNGGSRASNANAGLYISGSTLANDVSLQVAADGGRLKVSGSTAGFDVQVGGDYAINGTSVLNATTLGSNVVNSSLTSVGTLTTLTVDNVIVNGANIGHTDDTDLLTLADGVLTVAGEVSMTTLDIGGTNVTATAAEINLIDGGTARGTESVAAGDGFLHNDNGTMRMTNVSKLKDFVSGLNIYQLSGSGTIDGIIAAASGSGFYYNEATTSEDNGLNYEAVYMISGSNWNVGDTVRIKAPDFDSNGKISIYAQSSSLGDFAHSIEGIQSDTSGSNMGELGTEADDEPALVLESNGAAIALVLFAANSEGSTTVYNWSII